MMAGQRGRARDPVGQAGGANLAAPEDQRLELGENLHNLMGCGFAVVPISRALWAEDEGRVPPRVDDCRLSL
jgi:hypothetical protein